MSYFYYKVLFISNKILKFNIPSISQQSCFTCETL